MGVDYIIISYGHLLRVSHRCGSRLHHHQLRSLIQSLTQSSGAVGVEVDVLGSPPRTLFFCGRKATLNERIGVSYDKVQYAGLFGRREQRYSSCHCEALRAYLNMRQVFTKKKKKKHTHVFDFFYFFLFKEKNYVVDAAYCHMLLSS